MFDLMIYPEPVAKTPRHYGVNIEIQDAHDQVNLWDWLADSGSTIAREFHPEQSLRKGEADRSVWDAITTPADFEAFRKQVRDDPEGGPIQWGAYAFDRPVRWMGVPDGIIRKVSEVGVEPLVSMGYATKMYPRPLVKDFYFSGVPDDDGIDWSAAAGAYDYYFAMIYHFGKEFGTRYFLMHNEPECCTDKFHVPPECEKTEHNPYFMPETRQLTLNCLTTQWSVLARMAQAAMDDVRDLLGAGPDEFFLAGPVNGAWEQFWVKSGQYLDSLDYHHYHPDPKAFANSYDRVVAEAAEMGKRTSCSEFNVLPGSVPFTGMPFNITAALDLGRLLFETLRLSTPDEPTCEFLTLYLLNFPATHRNHKELLYGDMNCLDWTTRDFGLRGRSDEWYPTWQEQQVRHATVSYHFFRMLMRCVPGPDGPRDGYAVLRNGIECLIDDAHGREYTNMEVLVVDAGDRMYVNFLNRGGSPRMDLDLRRFAGRFKTAVIRETTQDARDVVVGEHALTDHRLSVTLSPQSLTQVILTPLDLSKIDSLRLKECTTTPGTAANLGHWQTTRFRAIATLDGAEIDVTDLNSIWASSDAWIVTAYHGGLLHRTRDSDRTITVTVATPNGVEAPAIAVPPAAGDDKDC